MALFLSTYVNSIDKKGRISVPESFRSVLLNEEFSGFVLYPSLTVPALEGCHMGRLQRLSQQLDHLDMFSAAHNDLADSIFAKACVMTFDSEGRIRISEDLLHCAKIEKEIAFVGRGATFQLWHPASFIYHQAKAQERLKEKPVTFHLKGD